jgi:hypothetical protein
MAKFSQEFLRQMATPAYGQGLFTAAQQAAQLPGQLRQQQQMKQQRQQLAQIDTNSPEGLLQLAQQYRKQGKITEALNAEKMARALAEKLQTAGISAKKAEGQQSLQVLAAVEGFNIDQRPRDAAEFFGTASDYGITAKEARDIYNAVKKTGSAKQVQSRSEITFRTNANNATYKQYDIQYRDGTTETKVIPQAGAPEVPDYSRGKTVISERTGAGAFDQPGIAGRTEEVRSFVEMQTNAIQNLSSLKGDVSGLKEAIDLLEDEKLKTGGFPRQVARGVARFLGEEPKELGQFETLLGNVVLAKLKNFKGSISEGERLFLIEQIGNYMQSGESNLGRLRVLLDQAERLLQDGILKATSEDYGDYLRRSGFVTKQELSFVPKEDREDALIAINTGQFTLDQVRKSYEKSRGSK